MTQALFQAHLHSHPSHLWAPAECDLYPGSSGEGALLRTALCCCGPAPQAQTFVSGIARHFGSDCRLVAGSVAEGAGVACVKRLSMVRSQKKGNSAK